MLILASIGRVFDIDAIVLFMNSIYFESFSGTIIQILLLRTLPPSHFTFRHLAVPVGIVTTFP